MQPRPHSSHTGQPRHWANPLVMRLVMKLVMRLVMRLVKLVTLLKRLYLELVVVRNM